LVPPTSVVSVKFAAIALEATAKPANTTTLFMSFSPACPSMLHAGLSTAFAKPA
jgi:hypothetical protein